MHFNRYILIFVLLLGFPVMANAQVIYQECKDYSGAPVVPIKDFAIDVVARAGLENGKAMIRYNPDILTGVSDSIRRFFYMRECALHVFNQAGGLEAPRSRNEKSADCWAVRTMMKVDGLSNIELSKLQNQLTSLTRSDWNYIPGRYRAIRLDGCVKGPDRSAVNRPGQSGFPKGYHVRKCGCWGSNPALLAREKKCRTGFALIKECAGFCTGGGNRTSYVCQ